MSLLKPMVVTMLSLLILFSAVVIYYDSSRTRIKNVKISKNINNEDRVLQEKILTLISNARLFDVDRVSLERKIASFSGDLRDVNVLVYPPDTVYVELVYRVPVIKFFTGSGYILYDEKLEEVTSYDETSFNRAVTVISKKGLRKEFLIDIVNSIRNLDEEITFSKYFPDVFIIDDGIYGFNSTFKINIYFGHSVDENKVKRAFLSTKYIIQKRLPVRYVDARFENVIAN